MKRIILASAALLAACAAQPPSILYVQHGPNGAISWQTAPAPGYYPETAATANAEIIAEQDRIAASRPHLTPEEYAEQGAEAFARVREQSAQLLESKGVPPAEAEAFVNAPPAPIPFDLWAPEPDYRSPCAAYGLCGPAPYVEP